MLLIAAPTQARERTNKTQVDLTKHSSQEIANTLVQVVIDTAWAYVTLDSAETDTSAWINLQRVEQGYPTLLTWFIDLDSGKVAVRYLEDYGVYWRGAQHADSSNILITTTTPLTTAGNWSYDVPFLGGWRGRFVVTARANNTGFRHGYQSMRQ